MNRLPNIEEFPERFRTKIKEDPIRGCWLWTAAKTSANRKKSYGQYWNGEKLILAHRFSYEFFNSKIPKRMLIDHLCRDSLCINPWHLEVVTQSINMKRSDSDNRRKTHCPKGHEYSGKNLYTNPSGARICKTCRNDAARTRYAMKEADNDSD